MIRGAVSAAAAAAACYLSVPKMSFSCSPSASPGACLGDAAVYNTGDALKETTYTYTSAMNGAKMTFDTDCSCWCNYVIGSYFPSAFDLITNDTTVKPSVPRAKQYYQYLAAQGADGTPWANVADIRTVKHGDVVAYALPAGSTDTGHVMFAIDDGSTPMTLPYSGRTDAIWVYVADASTVKHKEDTRCPSCQFQTGLGRGYMAFSFDANGAPQQFQFCDTCNWHAAQISAGRLTSAGQ